MLVYYNIFKLEVIVASHIMKVFNAPISYFHKFSFQNLKHYLMMKLTLG